MARVLAPFALGSEVVRRQKAYTKDDFVKTKLLFRVLFLVAFMAILSLFYIWSRVQVVQMGYTINSLKSRQLELREANKKLQVEVAALKSPQRVSRVAKEKLKMQAPEPAQMRMLPAPAE